MTTKCNQRFFGARVILSAVSPTSCLVAVRMMETARETGSSGSLRGSFLDLGGVGPLGPLGTENPIIEDKSGQDGQAQ